MLKLNKKGFTLIEMLVVLVLLVVIMSIAIPSITSTVERSKEKDRASKLELAKSAVELYIDAHRSCTSVGVNELINEKYLAGMEADEICGNRNPSTCCIDSSGTVVTCATTGACK